MSKLAADRLQRALDDLLKAPGNSVCADCKGINPRWASANLGIFICVRCASIHRGLGSHVSKVKSLTLDSWTKEQVEHMRQNGNTKSNLYYNPNETRNPPPTNMEESERDSELEKYIRSKYQHKRFVDRTARPKPSSSTTSSVDRSAQPPARAQSTPITKTVAPQPEPPKVPVFSPTLEYRPASSTLPQTTMTAVAPPTVNPGPAGPSVPPVPSVRQPTGGVWDDLLSLSAGPSTQAVHSPATHAPTNPYAGLAASPASAHTVPQVLADRSPLRSATMPATLPSVAAPMAPFSPPLAGQFQPTLSALQAPQVSAAGPGNPFLVPHQYPSNIPPTSPSPLSMVQPHHQNSFPAQATSLAAHAAPFQQPATIYPTMAGMSPYQVQQAPSPSPYQPPYQSPYQAQQAPSPFAQPQYLQQPAAFQTQPPASTNPFSQSWQGQQQQQPSTYATAQFMQGQYSAFHQPGWPSG